MRRYGGPLRRFEAPKIEPGKASVLSADHPAVVEGRTIFPSRVAVEADSMRYLIGGRNNPKIGAAVVKGPWAGMPIFTLTLEERATCPRSCEQWRACYGNSMHFPHRWDHRDPDFMPALKAEIITKAREHPKGLVIRLHVLGDFFSVEYVKMWAAMLDTFPQLHIYGYTARREDADDEESRRIARALRWLSDEAFDQFAMRFSGQPGPKGSVVIERPEDRGDAIICPAQTEKTATCGTCGLCWAPEAAGKTIAFLRHGNTWERAKTGAGRPPERRADEVSRRRAAMGSPEWWQERGYSED